MTCIAAVRQEGEIYMGADSAGVSGTSMQVRRDEKVCRVGDFLFGFTTSFRMGNLITFGFRAPPHDPEWSTERYMCTAFVDTIRALLKTGGFARVENGVEQGGEFLVAYRGRLFQVCSDFQVGENLSPFAAVGCGADLALGSLHTTQSTGMEAVRRITLALEAAEAFSTSVRRPFLVEKA